MATAERSKLDKRSIERARYHGPHGWKPRPGFGLDTIGRTLMECEQCSWLGWVFVFEESNANV